MATSVVILEAQTRALAIPDTRRFYRWPLGVPLTFGLAFLAIAVEGYHPYAEDGGLYAAGVERLLDPTLFPRWSNFVLAPTRVSAFAPSLAALVRISHLSFPAVLLLVHVATIWATLYAAYGIAEHCWHSVRSRVGAVVLLACWMGLPVAGTSLQVMDPYVTARSFSTPCALFLLLAILNLTVDSATSHRRKWLLIGAASVTLAFAMHPLMAGYGLAAACLLACLRSRNEEIQVVGPISCCVAAIGIAALLHYLSSAESDAYTRAALTRSYWFPARWSWYELFGIIAPLSVVAACSRSCRRAVAGRGDRLLQNRPPLASLAAMTTLLGATAIVVAFFFARAESPSHLVARLQPLRALQIVYIVMILSLGALLAQYILRRGAARWIAAIFLLGAPIFAAERMTFPTSCHIQLSEIDYENPWIRSFAWVRSHTPKDALFALDPDYIHAPGEDGQCFRAIAQRSALPDFSKDGGEASVAPQLAESWQFGLRAQQNLRPEIRVNRNSTSASALRAIGVSWVILRAGVRTDLNCPYSNLAAKVCKIT